MAKSRKRTTRRRRNPTGTLLVNPRRGGKSRRVRRSKKSGFSLKGLLGRLRGRKSNPRRHSKRRASGHRRRSKRNPLLTNPLLTNPRRRRSHKKSRSRRRHNPLLTNPKRHRKRRGHSRRRNPLLTNPMHIRRRKSRHGRRRNPMVGVLGGVQRKAQSLVSWIPLGIGSVLSGAIGVLGAALGGAIGVYPTSYALPFIQRYVAIPEWLKPFGYTVAGAILASGIKLLGGYVPVVGRYKEQIALGVATAGGAVDAYRYRHGKSQDLGEELGEDLGDEIGDDEIGDDGSPLAASEYADADLGDMEYAGDDFSDAEIAAAELGRKHYYKKFKDGKDSGPVADGVSAHAGKPGLRQGVLIYWIGFDNFKRLTKLPSSERREALEHMRREAKLAARKLLSEGADTTVAQAEMSGLLVA